MARVAGIAIMIIATTTLTITTYFILFGSKVAFTKLLDFLNENLASFAIIIANFFLFAILLSKFFYKGIGNIFNLKIEKSYYDDIDQQVSNKEIIRDIEDLRRQVSSFNESINIQTVLSEEDIKEAKNKVVESIVSNINSEASKEIRYKAHQEAIDSLESRSLARLSNLSVVLGSRANLTLMMGVIFCSLGLIATYASFFISPPDPNLTVGNQWIEIIKSYAPRFAMVIIIEVIGFFFLKLYKSTLSEIRYTHNEITNVEMRLIALHSASSLESDHSEMLLQALISTERNSVIDKNQTTVEIEQNRANADADRSILEAAVSLLHGNEKGSFWRRS